jgi:glycosyltransferase involved in cell wall biosynthesis
MDAWLNRETPVRRPRLCFVAPTAFPVLAGDRRFPFVGGAEVQQCTLAREFVRRGYPVSMICMDYGQTDPCEVDGITVHRAHAPDAGFPVVRFLHPRLSSLWAAMTRADADIYYQRAQGALTAFVAAFSRSRGKCSVYAAASDADFDPRAPFLRFARDRLLYRWGLRRVSGIVVQSERQHQDLTRYYGRHAALVRSCHAHAGKRARPGKAILWVGTIKRIKRPDLFIQLARHCPEHQFRLVGGDASDERRLFHRILGEAATLPNVELTGFVPLAEAEKQFDDGSVLVNTSEVEGFPNTFLQAWSRGMPTVSFFDPVARWRNHGVGEVAATVDDMASRVRSLMGDDGRWERAGSACREYFIAHHTVDRAADAYELLFEGLLAQTTGYAIGQHSLPRTE